MHMGTKIEYTAPHLKRLLRDMADPKIAESMQHFSKEPVRGLGVRTPEVRRLAGLAAKEYRRAKLPLDDILKIADRLWRRGTIEERSLAILIISKFKRKLERRHWSHFDGWVNTLTNWAETDGLCIYIFAPLLTEQPGLVPKLKPWTRSPNRWRRRAAAVALVPLARHGEQHEAAFDICDRLGKVRDDLVEKAIGWLLKEMSRTEPVAVTDYLIANIERLSRTTVRYACEKPCDVGLVRLLHYVDDYNDNDNDNDSEKREN
jgi:3-methyladenine DNA glycosylase AlkD